MNVPALITKEKPEITVILSDEYSEIKKKFRCPNCGKVVFEYYSPIRVIMPGHAEPATRLDKAGVKHFSQVPIITECRNVIIVTKNGVDLNTRCKTKLLVT